MPSDFPAYPFDSQRCIGTVIEVNPDSIRANFPMASLSEGRWLFGHKLGTGEVSEFVVVECGDFAVLGRVMSVHVPEKERVGLEIKSGTSRPVHPVGSVQLLTSISLKKCEVLRGVVRHPRIGGKVYAAHPLLVKWIVEVSQTPIRESVPIVLDIGKLAVSNNPIVTLTPESVFGRHCAVLGSTGGGKSWTIARLLEELAKYRSKAILLDATGEFNTLSSVSRHVHIGTPWEDVSSENTVVPYLQLTETDFFALVRPSPAVQAPKLRSAIRTLKLANTVGNDCLLVNNGVIVKANNPRQQFDELCEQHAEALLDPHLNFDITKLCQQIEHECVFPTAYGGDATRWGGPVQNDVGHCVGLQSRIDEMLNSEALSSIFKHSGKISLFDVIQQFLTDGSQKILRISLKYLSDSNHCREVVANAIGRYLLAMGRDGKFTTMPLLIFLDEAHRFLNRSLGDENNKYLLDAFDLIAKEGRKFALDICLATQRPRDIPEGVLSQMGTLIVHRLTNANDREVVEKAAGDLDKAAAKFLPTLTPGEALIVGVGFPMPLAIQMLPPKDKPESEGAQFQQLWTENDAATE